jgi:hypothetical protein
VSAGIIAGNAEVDQPLFEVPVFPGLLCDKEKPFSANALAAEDAADEVDDVVERRKSCIPLTRFCNPWSTCV